jgi:hypothetical protein
MEIKVEINEEHVIEFLDNLVTQSNPIEILEQRDGYNQDVEQFAIIKLSKFKDFFDYDKNCYSDNKEMLYKLLTLP